MGHLNKDDNFNTKALDKLNADLVHVDDDADAATENVYIFGPNLYHVRNVIFEQKKWDEDAKNYILKNEDTNFEYGTYLGQKGYKIKDHAVYDEGAFITKLESFGFKPQVYHGLEG